MAKAVQVQVLLSAPNYFKFSMKRFVLMALAAALLAGCVRYDMLLTNGGRITNVSKPRFDATNGIYSYKDVTGRERYVSAGRVVQIMPHSRKNENGFNNP